MSITTDTSIRRLVLGFTPKGTAPITLPSNFDVEVHVRGQEVSLEYAGTPRSSNSRNIPPEVELNKLRKADLIQLIEGYR